MELQKFADNVRSTGFELEYRISEILRGHGWRVINNKYYIDDQQETVREIDLVAYKVTQVQHFWVYTTLVISCKKSEDNLWALFSKKIDPKDPNADWHPLRLWTNDKALAFMTKRPEWKDQHTACTGKFGASNLFGLPTTQIFAFQEMNKTSGKVQNDKAIFASVTSLMKAQAYELEALPKRKKAACVYQFNLLSVVDTDLLRILFDGDKLSPFCLDEDRYVASYIVRGKETSSRIHFVRANAFENVLSRYDNLHQAQICLFSEACDEFYRDILKSFTRTAILKDEFRKAVCEKLSSRLYARLKVWHDLKRLWLRWRETEDKIGVILQVPEEQVEFLNADIHAKEMVKNALREIYRYAGDLVFEVEDIPF